MFLLRHLEGILLSYRSDWGLPKNRSSFDLIEILTRKTALREVILTAQNHTKNFTRYVWPGASKYEIGISLRPRSYLSHATAAFLQGLLDKEYGAIYVNQEQSPKERGEGHFSQESIDRAFRKKQRQSRFIFSEGKNQYQLLNGKHTGNLAVETRDGHAITSVERTLIDLVVRPEYAGGAGKVLEAFKRAKRKASVDRIAEILNSLDYLYPYHQSIGFYAESAGFSLEALRILRQFPFEFDFHVAHGMTAPSYDGRWRVYFPRDLNG